MIDEKTITAGTKALASMNELGELGLTIFFVLIILGITFIFLKLFLTDMKKVIENNTSAMNDLTKSIEVQLRNMERKQQEMHEDIKDILHYHTYKQPYMKQYNVANKNNYERFYNNEENDYNPL